MSSARSPGIFLSHAHEDKPFVRHLARDLTSAGVKVWIDEAEMGVGDSLLDKITFAISEMDYLGVVISAYSAHSDWVTREIEIAMSEEIAGKRVKVIPLLLRGGVLPSVLTGKVFADFTSEPAYPDSLQRLVARLGVPKTSPSIAVDRLTELASSSGLLAAALAELRRVGLTNATAQALASSKVADVELSEFLSLAAEDTLRSQQLFGLAISLVQYIDERGVGQQALDFCLRSGRLEDWQIEYVGIQMQYVKSSAAVLWCHSRMTSLIRSDTHYHSFLQRHIDIIVDQRYDDMAAYLLQPLRGPGDYNIDSFELVISHVEDPTPFQSRMIDWIKGGYFDFERNERKEDWETPRILYLMLNEHWSDAKFGIVAKAIHDRVYLLVKSGSQNRLSTGMFHLVAMVDAKYLGVDQVVHNLVLPSALDVGFEHYELLEVISKALKAVVAFNEDPSNDDLERNVTKLYHEIADADRKGITGYWGRSGELD
jgi:hypothetical protein